MPAQPWCTGPAHTFIKFPTGDFSGITKYLGTTEFEPKLDFNPEYEELYNDIGGRKIPFDRLYQGEEAMLTGTFSRWDEAVYASMAALPASASPRGLNVPGDIGTLMGFEGKAPEVLLLYPYAIAKAAFSGLPPGYHFYAGILQDHGKPKNGTGQHVLAITYLMQRKYYPSASGNILAGSFLTYDAAGLSNLLTLVN